MLRDVIIFANSVKHGAHCVAAKSLVNGKWIRLVGDGAGCALAKEQVKVQTTRGTYPVLPLEVVTVDIQRRASLLHQPENFIINDVEWKRNRFISAHSVGNYAETPESLWGGGDRVAAQQLHSGAIVIQQSLYLIQPTEMELYLRENKRRVAFSYNDQEYDFAATDPNFDKIKSGEKKANGYICVSLGEEFQGQHYKIAAAII